ncbi:MAG: LysE family translocator [Opitutus sp.]|nr:LysE family translocator [Opitutus sp.]
MHDYWVEFSQVALAHLLAVASPGPDFAIVLKQSLTHGRRTAIWTSLGVGTAILLHVTYSLGGIGLLIRSSELWFNLVKWAGAAYIAWLGVQALRAQPRLADPASGAAPTSQPTPRGAFATGFFTNALNPKVTLFFVSLFVLLVNPLTPKLIQAAYGAWMAGATMAWFSLVSVVFTREDVRRSFLRHGHWIDRTLGVVFLGFAASLVVSSVR